MMTIIILLLLVFLAPVIIKYGLIIIFGLIKLVASSILWLFAVCFGIWVVIQLIAIL